MSEYFKVSTDYLLKGIKEKERGDAVTSRILYISSSLAVIIGLFITLGGWDAKKPLGGLAVGMLIQAVGFTAYFIGESLSEEKHLSL